MEMRCNDIQVVKVRLGEIIERVTD